MKGQRVPNCKEILAANGLRCTKQREKIYRALCVTKSHPTAEELRQLVPGMSTATIYNTLEALCAAGLCKKLTTESTASRYDADTSEHLHVVLENGRLLDVPPELGAALLESMTGSALHDIESELCIEVQQLRIELHATCCQRAVSS